MHLRSLLFVIVYSYKIRMAARLEPSRYIWSDRRPGQQSDGAENEDEDHRLVFGRVSLEACCEDVLLLCALAYRQVMLQTELAIAVVAGSSLPHETGAFVVGSCILWLFAARKLNQSAIGEACAFAERGRSCGMDRCNQCEQ